MADIPSVDISCIDISLRKLLLTGNSLGPKKEGFLMKHVNAFIIMEKRKIQNDQWAEKYKKAIKTLEDRFQATVLEERGRQPVEVSGAGNDLPSGEVDEPLAAPTRLLILPPNITLGEHAKGAINDMKAATSEVTKLIEEGKGQMVLDSLKAATKVCGICQEIVVLCLVLLTKQKDGVLVTSAYSAVPEICKSTRLLFLFLILCKMFTKSSERTAGWGRGLKRAVRIWYLRWDPRALALEISRHPQAYTWTHQDVLKLAHISHKRTSVEMKIVLNYVFSGLENTKTKFAAEVDSNNVFPLLELLHIEANEINDPDKMIERGRNILRDYQVLFLNDFPRRIHADEKVMEFLLKNGTPNLIIEALIKTKLVKQTCSNQEFSLLLTARLKEESFANNLDSLYLVVVYNMIRRKAFELAELQETMKERKWMHNAQPNTEKSKKAPATKVLPSGLVPVIDALGAVIIKATQKTKRTTKTAHVFIDSSITMKNYVSISFENETCKEVRAIQAASLILLSLASNAHFSEVTPFFFATHGTNGLKLVDVPRPCSMHFLQTKLKGITTGPVSVNAAAISTAENVKDTCLILCDQITEVILKEAFDNLKTFESNEISKNMRMIICGFEFAPLPNANNFSHPNLLVLHGFNRTAIPTIEAFHERLF